MAMLLLGSLSTLSIVVWLNECLCWYWLLWEWFNQYMNNIDDSLLEWPALDTHLFFLPHREPLGRGFPGSHQRDHFYFHRTIINIIISIKFHYQQINAYHISLSLITIINFICHLFTGRQGLLLRTYTLEARTDFSLAPQHLAIIGCALFFLSNLCHSIYE